MYICSGASHHKNYINTGNFAMYKLYVVEVCPLPTNSQTKSSLSLVLKPPFQNGTSNSGKCAFNYQPKDYRRRGGENVCLIYLVLCASSSHHPFTESIERTLHLPSSQAGIGQRSVP